MSSGPSVNNLMNFALIFILLALILPATSQQSNWIPCIDEYPLFAGDGAIWIFEEDSSNPLSIRIQLRGPSDRWFGIGFGKHIMNNTYAIVISDTVKELSLAHHGIGTEITPSIIDLISTDVTAFEREIILDRPIESREEDIFDFKAWLGCTVQAESLDIIEAVGVDSNPGFHEINKWTTSITSCKCPTPIPTLAPSTDSTIDPTNNPTEGPTYNPTHHPTVHPTIVPTFDPTNHPIIHPTVNPTKYPTDDPTNIPTLAPTKQPTIDPTVNPTKHPTTTPTVDPTESTVDPTLDPSLDPTNNPTSGPTSLPTLAPTQPTLDPTIPSMSPTNDPTVEPTKQLTTKSPTRRICDGSKYQNKMLAFRNDSLWPEQDFVSNNCHCKFTLHKNGSLTLYGKIDEFADFVVGWSTHTKISNFSGVSVPQFSIKIDGTIVVSEYYYAPDLPPIPIWTLDIFSINQNIRRLNAEDNNKNFSFHLSDECCLSIRDNNNDYVYWSICTNITAHDDGSKAEDKNKSNDSLWLIVAPCLCVLLCICCVWKLYINKQYQMREEKNAGKLKYAENVPAVDTDCNETKKNLDKYDSYYFDQETTQQIELWGEIKLENDPTIDGPENPPEFMQSSVMVNNQNNDT